MSTTETIETTATDVTPPDASTTESGMEMERVDHDTERQAATDLVPGLAGSAVENTLVQLGFPTPSEMAVMRTLADTFAHSMIVAKALRGRPDDIMVVLLTGRDLRLSPTYALSKVHVIDGKPGLAAEAMSALIRRAGFKIGPVSMTRTEAVAYGERDGERATFSFDLDDAVAAELVKITPDGKVQARDSQGRKLPWEKYTKSMLWARAVSGLARMMFSDVLAGVTYTPDELGATWVDESGNPIDAESSVGSHGGPDLDAGARDFGWASNADAEAAKAIRAEFVERAGESVRKMVRSWLDAFPSETRPDGGRGPGCVRQVAAILYFAERPDISPTAPFAAACDPDNDTPGDLATCAVCGGGIVAHEAGYWVHRAGGVDVDHGAAPATEPPVDDIPPAPADDSPASDRPDAPDQPPSGPLPAAEARKAERARKALREAEEAVRRPPPCDGGCGRESVTSGSEGNWCSECVPF